MIREEHLRESKLLTEERVSARHLLTRTRFDMGAKLSLGSLLVKSIDVKSTLQCNTYRAFLSPITRGKMSELGSKKVGVEDYLRSFGDLVNSIKENGFYEDGFSIPRSENGDIVNGAHRVAICALLFPNFLVPTVKLKEESLDYSATYFGDAGIAEPYLDNAALSLVENLDDVYIACIWPSSGEKAIDIEDFLRDRSFYRKTVKLTELGKKNLMLHLYPNEGWIGTPKDAFRGLNNKIQPCFGNKGEVTFIFFRESSLENVIAIKELVREMVGIGKHSVHITDTRQEALMLSRTLLSYGGLKVLNNAKPWKFPIYYSSLKGIALSSGSSGLDYALTGSALMGLLGERPPSDIDYISHDILEYNIKNTEGLLALSRHDSELRLYPDKVDRLLVDGYNYFYFMNVKFLSANIIYQIKKSRYERKDKEDLISLERFIEDKIPIYDIFLCVVRRGYSRFRWSIISMLKAVGLFKLVYKLYRKMLR